MAKILDSLFLLCSIPVMQDFADMAEAHEWTMRRLREMTGRLTEQAYVSVTEAVGSDEEAAARWMVIFDRMARGLRLTVALEAKVARERRWDADEIQREATGRKHEPRWRKGTSTSSDTEPSESDAEHEDDGLPAGATNAQRIERLTNLVMGAGEPEPEPVLYAAEILARDARRHKRAQRAGSNLAPYEPWDTLPAAERTAALAERWRGSG